MSAAVVAKKTYKLALTYFAHPPGRGHSIREALAIGNVNQNKTKPETLFPHFDLLFLL
jgi:hypothetical protein